MRIRRTTTPAFTLAELLIAMLFISIALFGFVALQMRLLDSNERLFLKQEAVLKAESELGAAIAQARRGPGQAAAAGAAPPAPQAVEAKASWKVRGTTLDYQVDSLVLPVRYGW